MKVAEEAVFEVLVTTDKNMVTQQNLKGRAIGRFREDGSQESEVVSDR